ncbi:MAG TPA: DUF1800 domain-containing protein [Pirellulaceae bacterium]|nr:DUF1800 domain-containing protein [Pirellulaceae bacterium]
MSSWQLYRPNDSAPWNTMRVVHLHRRAGFAATWNEIQRDVMDGPDAAITRLLQGRSYSNGVPADFEQMAAVIGDAAIGSNNPNRLKAWWIYRFLFSPDPLTEKLTLLWHDHFATSNLKINDLSMMRRQNEILRANARAPFRQLLGAVVHDPAMLVWLDADSNRKGSPNENLARELMELFTIGIGNYTEHDVKEAARALTGWSVRRNAYFENPEVHDDGEKTILGQTGRWRGDNLLGILLDHSATARRLAWRICNLLMGEQVVDDAGLDELAEGLREHDLDIGWTVETVLRSQAFFSESNIAARVASPLEFAIGAVRALECFDPPPSTLLLAEWAARMGQDLFYPPNVGGWSGGRDWLAGRYVVARANFAAQLAEGKLWSPVSEWDVSEVVERSGGQSSDPADVIDTLAQLLLVTRLPEASRSSILASVEQKKGTSHDRIRWAAATLLSLPDAQFV